MLDPRPTFGAFEQRLRELGYGEGQNLSIDYVQLEGREEVDRYIQAIKGIVQRGIDTFLAASDNGRRQPCITPTLNAWLRSRGRLKMHSAALASRSRKRRQKALRNSKTASARTACSRWLQAGGSSCPVRG